MRQAPVLLVISSCFAAIFLFFYAPVLFSDQQFAYRDAGNYYYPLNKRVQAEWTAGRWPLWEPEENAGMPLLGNPTAAVLYPGKFVFAILPDAWAARTYILMHTALAFLTILVLMRSWETSWQGAGISALAYAFGAPVLFQYCNIIYLIGAAWLPLGFHAADGWVRLGLRWRLLELAIVLAMQVLGGDPQSAYLLGLASIGYAVGVAWSRATSKRKSRRSLLLLGLVPVVWYVLTVAVAYGVSHLREPGKPPAPTGGAGWLPTAVAIFWAVGPVSFLAYWRRRGGRRPLGVMWLGLAGAAALAAAVTAAQLFPVIEFMAQTGRSSAGPDEIYRYGLDPCQLIGLIWPNFLGTPFGANNYWRDLLPASRDWFSLWVPSLYLGGLTVALALGSMSVRHGPAWRIWLTVVAGLSVAASLGHDTSPIRLTRAVAATAGSATIRNWLPDLGPFDPPGSGNTRIDGYPHDSDGSFYWFLSAVFPGFRQFRYPAKLFTLTALAMSGLAGLGWDRLVARQARGPVVVLVLLLFLTSITLIVVVFQRDPIVASLRGLEAPSQFGPFEAAAGYRAMIIGLGQAMIVLALGTLLAALAWRQPRWSGSAALVLMTADLAVANARFILTVPQSVFDTRPEVLAVIEEAERSDPAPGPFRIHRMPQWFPVGWNGIHSKDRIAEVGSWEHDTLFPKYGINFGQEYTHTIGVAQLEDFERFFNSFYVRVPDEQAARHLDVTVGQNIVYHPRRAYDLWNTRYLIVAFDSNGYADPPRSSAAFLFQSRQLYPDPGRFAGADGADQARRWAETRDFKVIRNLTEYPRSWIVHGARPIGPAADVSPRSTSESMREMLYAADPLWNNGSRRVFDPRAIAWVSRDKLADLRPYLSGATTGSSETVVVRYPGPGQAVLEAKLDAPGLVILADVYYPGWELVIDDTPSPIYQVNGAMRGAAVGAGTHRLVYTYNPLSWRIGRLVSITGLAALLILGVGCAIRPVDPTLSDRSS